MAIRVAQADRRLIDGEAAVARLFAATFAGLRQEALLVAYLNASRHLIAEDRFASNMCDMVALPIRVILRDALLHDAAGLVIAHNHPSGDASPSRADLLATRDLLECARPLGIRLHDHVIFAGDKTRSLHGMGLL